MPTHHARSIAPSLVAALLSAALLSTATAARAQQADPYDDAVALSDAAEARGDLAAAARPLEVTLGAYPQDHALPLRLGWVYLRAGRFVDAERAYRLSLSIAPRSDDARLGLGSALVGQARCAEARAQLEPLLARRPASPQAAGAERALSSCAPEPKGVAALFVAWNRYLYPGHATKQSGNGVLVSAGGRTAGGWVLQGAFRHVAFTPSESASSWLGSFSQNEAYGQAGYAAPGGAFLLQGAVVADGSGTLGTSRHVGFSARWTEGSDLLLDASLSLYDDLTVGRVAPSWSVPVAGPLRLIPGLALQRAGDETKLTGSISAALDWPSLSLWGGGKYGEEIRPAYLGQLAVYDIKERVAWGAWAGARVRLGSTLSIVGSYALDHLTRTDSLTPAESNSHAVTLGPLITF
jgi:tetratricopeptide (TPR) repeat protein